MSAILGAPSVAAALTWSVSDPVPSPAPDAVAPIAQDWLAGESIPEQWTPPVDGPIDARAVAKAGPGGTLYAASAFEASFAGAVAVRVRTDVMFRVWLDGRLIGGAAQAPAWTQIPIAMPATLEAGAHRLLIELRPAFGQRASLAAAITTPAGKPIDWQPLASAPVRAAAVPTAPVAIKAVDVPATARPAQVWRPSSSLAPAALTPPPMPDIEAVRAHPRWPDAPWVVLWDAQTWVLDTRRRARRVVGRVNSVVGLAAARAFLNDFDTVSIIGPDGAEPGTVDQVQVGTLFTATRAGTLPADPLGLGAARLLPIPAPTWHLDVTIEAPRSWTLARRARGIGGAKIVDDRPSRRAWRYRADAVPANTAELRVSRADGPAGFAQLAAAGLRDHLRPFKGQPTCASARHADPLTRAITCAREGAQIVFLRGAGRPALSGPVDLTDFDAIASEMPSWAAVGLRLDGTTERGKGIVERRVELTPAKPTVPAFRIEGPCGADPVAAAGTLQTQIDVRLAGLTANPPEARRRTAGPLSHARHVERTADGWRVTHRVRWTDLSAVPPAGLAAACRRLAQP